MNEQTSSPQFEDQVRRSFEVPEIRTDFVEHVYVDLMQLADKKPVRSRLLYRLSPAWTVVLVVLSLFIISTFVIGPKRVYAAITKIFGYLPGVGIIDQSLPIRKN